MAHGGEGVARALGLRFVRRCSGGEFGAVLVEDASGDWRSDVAWLAFWCRVDRHQVAPLAAELAGRRAAELLTPAERAAYAGLAAFRVIDLISHQRAELLPRALGWCEAHLAPLWR